MQSCRSLLAAIFVLLLAHTASAAVYQWSAPVGGGRAFLWIPPDCQRVRAVLVAQHNMIEGGMLDNEGFRWSLAKLGIAEVWIAPPIDGVFRFDQGAGDRFDAIMKSLADASGYEELAVAPIIPMGHSACASYPWNFAAWNPGRTLAVLSVHGDAPQTNRTGSGHPNPEWGERSIDGVPGLMVMGEYEWYEDRMSPALDFHARHPNVPFAFLAEPGHGHFDYSAHLLDFLATFIRKAAEARLPLEEPALPSQPPILRPVDPQKGWLVERWHPGKGRSVPPAPYASYTGDRTQAFWAFDEETAWAIQNYNADQVGKKPQLLGFAQDGKPVPMADLPGREVREANLKFTTDADGVTFHVAGRFLDTVEPGATLLTFWSCLPSGAAIGHAGGNSPIEVSRITGPVEKVAADTFALKLDRTFSTLDSRNPDIWLLASQPGDKEYKSAYNEAVIHVPRISGGKPQTITFPSIPDQPAGTATVPLAAKSDDPGATVHYYVRDGPAEIDGDGQLRLLPLPPRTRYPVQVTVVAWQWGHAAEPKLDTAELAERSFYIQK